VTNISSLTSLLSS